MSTLFSESAFFLAIVIGAGVADATETIIDNGDPGFSQSGFARAEDAGSWRGDAMVATELSESAFARFTPGLTGHYDVHLYCGDFADKDAAVPWVVAHAGGQVVHRYDQRHRPGWHFAGSYTLEADSYVELRGQYGTDHGAVADAVKFTPTVRRVVRRKARDTITPVTLNHGDELHFTLRNGQVRRVKLLDTEAHVLAWTERPDRPVKTYRFSAKLDIDGQRHVFQRVAPTQESFYEPLERDGLRLWLDAVSDIFVDDGGFLEQRDVYGSGTSSRPKRKARLVVNDVRDRICPEPLAWWYPETADRIDVERCYRGEDVWMGPYNGKKAHSGLDINMTSGTPLFAPIRFDDHYLFDALEAGDINNRWRGERRWPDGTVWWLQAHHLNRMLVAQGGPLARGTRYAETAGVHVGAAEHTHFVFRVLEKNDCFFLDPWLIFWQTFRDHSQTLPEVQNQPKAGE